jgi:8-oxo-dGTP diphosphatase
MRLSEYAVGMLSLYALLVTLWARSLQGRYSSSKYKAPADFHGHSTRVHRDGSCWCSADEYCMCTPAIATDCIIELQREGGAREVLLVERRDGRGFAMVGGFVKVDESAEAAARREIREEISLNISELVPFRLYSEPGRDPRRHTASQVFIARGQISGTAKAGDDATSFKAIPIRDLQQHKVRFAFDHQSIIDDWLGQFHPELYQS